MNASPRARRALAVSVSLPATALVTRRRFVTTALTSAAAIALGRGLQPASAAAPRDLHRAGFIDTNITLGRWPFRRLPLDEPSALAAKLRQHGVTQAWAGSFDGLFYQDLAAANARLAQECRKVGRGWMMPFGSVNPKLPGWEDEFRRCVEDHEMPGLRLYPNYHGYDLDSPALAKLLSLASDRRLLVQFALSMEDERMQHRLARVPHVAAAPLIGRFQNFPGLPVVLLNWQRAVDANLLRKLAGVGAVHFDIATLEGVGGVANLLAQIPSDRVLFGSHAPWFCFESALLKLRESALSEEEQQAIRSGNARRLLQK